MDETPRFPVEPDFHREGMGARQLLIIAAVALVVVAGIFVLVSRRPSTPPAQETAPREVSRVPEGSRTVTLYFAAADEPNIYGESREVAVGRRLDEQVRQVMAALIAGPEHDTGISAIPVGTKLLSVLLDDATDTIYLDFSSDLVAAHPGGSAAEYCTIAAIVRTIGENFPEIKAVQILIDGSQVDSIAGHIRADVPFRVSDWR